MVIINSARFFNIQKWLPSSVSVPSHIAKMQAITASCVSVSKYMNAVCINVPNSNDSSDSSEPLSHNMRPIKFILATGSAVQARIAKYRKAPSLLKHKCSRFLCHQSECFGVINDGGLHRIQQNTFTVCIPMIGLTMRIVVRSFV